jgi:hypothetical protein
MLRVMPALFVAAAALVAGCAGTIDVVHEAKNGGTVALHGPEHGAREKAGAHMRERCPDGYEIVEEGEATEDGEREWRITYACKGATGQVSRLAL